MSPDVHTLTGAYALDALDPDERAEFETHLAECSACTHEVAELRATAARLGAAVASTPPENLKGRVLLTIARTRQEPSSGPRLVGRDPNRRRTWTVRLSVAAAVIAVAAAGTFGGIAISANSALHTAQSQLNQEAPVEQLLSAPDLRIASGTAAGGWATLFTSHQLGRSVLITAHMPVQATNKTYQVWGMGPAGAASLAVLGNGSGGTFTLSGLGSATTIGITLEPAGGSRQPTSAPIMQFSIPA
ncbi:MAG TPA: anti-sigma factor [Pseudonocardiaceae bacterium]|jgi:anti-sigma factor RsiW